MRKPQKTDKGGKALALLAWGQFAGALLAVALGVHYDSIEREPGFLVLAGLGVLGGPAFVGAWRLAHGIGGGGHKECDHHDDQGGGKHGDGG